MTGNSWMRKHLSTCKLKNSSSHVGCSDNVHYFRSQPLKIINFTDSSSSALRISYISVLQAGRKGILLRLCVPMRVSECDEISGKMRWELKNPEFPVLMPDRRRRRFYLKKFFLHDFVMSSSWISALCFFSLGIKKNQRKLNLIIKNHVQLYVCVIGDLLARNPPRQVLFVITASETLCFFSVKRSWILGWSIIFQLVNDLKIYIKENMLRQRRMQLVLGEESECVELFQKAVWCDALQWMVISLVWKTKWSDLLPATPRPTRAFRSKCILT